MGCEAGWCKTPTPYDYLPHDMIIYPWHLPHDMIYSKSEKKSQIIPTQKIKLLEFKTDSLKMILTLTDDKKQKLTY